jgi:hypothetical protein
MTNDVAGSATPTSSAAAKLSACAAFAAAAIGMTACTAPTPTRQAAEEQTIASGLLCLADAAGKVVVTAGTHDPNTVKAVNASIAAGNVLLTDGECRSALVTGAAVAGANN